MAKTKPVGMKLQLGTAILETLFAIPVIGAVIIVGGYWIPMLIGLVAHIVTLVLTTQTGGRKLGPIMGIVACTIGIIPFVGWVLHVLAAIFNWIGAFKEE